MKTLWTFGDSFTYGFGCRFSNNLEGIEKLYYENYFDKSKDDTWPNHLGKLLNYNVNNFGKNGYSNWDIIDSIIKESNNIKENDIVVIGKTHSFRNRYPQDNNQWNQINESQTNVDEKTQAFIDYQTYLSDHPLYKERQELLYKYIIDNLYKVNKVSKVFTFKITDLKNFNITRIHNDTQKKINDYHPSRQGQLEMANIFYEKITNNKPNLI